LLINCPIAPLACQQKPSPLGLSLKPGLLIASLYASSGVLVISLLPCADEFIAETNKIAANKKQKTPC